MGDNFTLISSMAILVKKTMAGVNKVDFVQVELRGPLPSGEGDQQEDAVSLASEAESMTTSIMSISSQR